MTVVIPGRDPLGRSKSRVLEERGFRWTREKHAEVCTTNISPGFLTKLNLPVRIRDGQLC